MATDITGVASLDSFLARTFDLTQYARTATTAGQIVRLTVRGGAADQPLLTVTGSVGVRSLTRQAGVAIGGRYQLEIRQTQNPLPTVVNTRLSNSTTIVVSNPAAIADGETFYHQ